MIPASTELVRWIFSQKDIIVKCWPTCVSRSVSWSFQIRRPQLEHQKSIVIPAASQLREKGSPSTAPSSKRNIAASDCASSAAKYLMKKPMWSAYSRVNVRNQTSEMVVAWENLDTSRQLQASQHAASPRPARARPLHRFPNAPEYQESQMHPPIPGLASSRAPSVYPTGHQGGAAG